MTKQSKATGGWLDINEQPPKPPPLRPTTPSFEPTTATLGTDKEVAQDIVALDVTPARKKKQNPPPLPHQDKRRNEDISSTPSPARSRRGGRRLR